MADIRRARQILEQSNNTPRLGLECSQCNQKAGSLRPVIIPPNPIYKALCFTCAKKFNIVGRIAILKTQVAATKEWLEFNHE